MAKLNKAKELLSILSNQKSGIIPSWMAKDASKKLIGDNPNTCRTEAIIKKLNENENHPALAAKIKEAEKEISQYKELNQNQKPKRFIRI